VPLEICVGSCASLNTLEILYVLYFASFCILAHVFILPEESVEVAQNVDRLFEK